MVTAGGTKENIDPVRYIGNYSSGKMGTAVADAAARLGADVTLVKTFDLSRSYETIDVKSAQEMLQAVEKEFLQKNADILIMAAAVSDFRVKNPHSSKITKKRTGEELTLELIQNPDILKYACENKKENQKVVGFCLSTENTVENAKEKILKKGCDFIVANEAKVALGSDENEVWIIDKNLNIEKVEKTTKDKVAKVILEKLYD